MRGVFVAEPGHNSGTGGIGVKGRGAAGVTGRFNTSGRGAVEGTIKNTAGYGVWGNSSGIGIREVGLIDVTPRASPPVLRALHLKPLVSPGPQVTGAGRRDTRKACLAHVVGGSGRSEASPTAILNDTHSVESYFRNFGLRGYREVPNL